MNIMNRILERMQFYAYSIYCQCKESYARWKYKRLPKVELIRVGIIYKGDFGIQYVSTMTDANSMIGHGIRIGNVEYLPNVVYDSVDAIERCIINHAQLLTFTDLEDMRICNRVVSCYKN